MVLGCCCGHKHVATSEAELQSDSKPSCGPRMQANRQTQSDKNKLKERAATRSKGVKKQLVTRFKTVE